MDIQDHFSDVARESLNTFDQIAVKASLKAQKHGSQSGTSLASINTFTDTNAVSNLDSIAADNIRNYQALAGEPAIFRVYAMDEDGVERTLYISRGESVSLDGDIKLASYRSPLGRLAAKPVGEEISIPIRGEIKRYEVLEKVSLKPRKDDEGWESINSVFDSEEYKTQTITSFRKLLGLSDVEVPTATKDIEDSALLDALLAGGLEAPVEDGVRHQVLKAMELRDQPILDQFQDEIFRLPINSQLIILGPPGTGKTTTLIKRLGQKLSIAYLEDAELRLVDKTTSGRDGHSRSWIMFTPTDLLKQFVKEAFNREQVPASSEHIKTWTNHRNYLARNVLGILQSSNSRGFILKTDRKHLSESAESQPTVWFDEFSLFHEQRIVSRLKEGYQQLESIAGDNLTELVSKISTELALLERRSLMSCYVSLDLLEPQIVEQDRVVNEELKDLLRRSVAIEVNRNKSFLNELAKFVDTLKALTEPDIEEELDVEEDEPEQVATPVQKAFNIYNGAIRALGTARFNRRTLSKKSRNAAIIEWLGDRVPDESRLQEIGRLAGLRRALRRFIRPSVQYLKLVPNSYQAYRKESFSASSWYKSLPENAKHIEEIELDLLLLSVLKNGRKLLQERFVQNKLEQSGFSLLETISSSFRNQILVDEATDFSPLQLAAMESLTDVNTGSFFACGDFNQRITSWGIRSSEQFSWISNQIEARSIRTVYRQSQKLNEFAKNLLGSLGGDISNVGELSEHSSHVGVCPVFAANVCGVGEQASWLGERIREIEHIVSEMPTVAVLVNGEEHVRPLAEALNQQLEDISINAVACVDGQTIGEGTDVRVFDVQHIKGLEFEAVFFVDVDHLYAQQGELFTKYLYVGATRAATYFGLTCSKETPAYITGLTEHFVCDWS